MRTLIALFFVVAMVGIACHKDLKDTQDLQNSDGSMANMRAQLSSRKLNIIYIMSDDIGYEIPTYSGGASYSTPNLDMMAAQGVEFTNFFSHPDGGPSRLAALTGKYSFRNYEDWGYLPPDSKTFGNMLQDAGYATAFTGKWQLDGGDKSIRGAGFAQYLAFLPYQPSSPKSDTNQYYRRYKNPLLYQNGKYLPDAKVKGKYSEDLFYQFAADFIDSNRTKPFLLFYSCNLAQKPWSPTPDHPDYKGWNQARDDEARQDKKYFPDMVAYMDKNIGKLITKVQEAGIAGRTVFIFTSDNGTNRNIKSIYKGSIVSGGKNYTTRVGINVPLLAYGSTKVLKGVTDTSLVDMTDFLPTMAGIASIPVPTTYGKLDGVTFSDNISGTTGKQRTYVFCHWEDVFVGTGRPPLQRYCFDYDYKLYDTVNNSRFYNIRLDPGELNPLPNSALTPEEVAKRNKLQSIMDKLK